MSADFTIFGAGVAGLSMAAELTTRGAKVQVIAPAGPPGDHACSWWAGGMLAPECEGLLTEPAIVHHGRAAADWWEGHGATVTRNGTLVVALGRDSSELRTFQRRVPAAEALDASGIAELEPDLDGRFRQGLFLPSEAHLDPRATLAHLHARVSDAGTVISGKASPTGTLVDCRGLSARNELPDLRGVKGEMVVVRCPDVALTRPVRLLHPRFPLYIVPRSGSVFMLGATQIESGERNRATVRSVMELLNAAYALHPAFGEAE